MNQGNSGEVEPLELVWEVAAISRLIGRSERQTFYLLNSGALPAKKVVEEDRPWATVSVKFERVALTAGQVKEFDLPTAPPKATDSRSKAWSGETCQLEALPPNVIADILKEHIGRHFDADQFDAELLREAARDQGPVIGVRHDPNVQCLDGPADNEEDGKLDFRGEGYWEARKALRDGTRLTPLFTDRHAERVTIMPDGEEFRTFYPLRSDHPKPNDGKGDGGLSAGDFDKLPWA